MITATSPGSAQTTIEGLETSNEELKSENEELPSTNEELQSANEELETSKEMRRTCSTAGKSTIFLNIRLKIARYTEQAKRLASLIQTDVGRPLADLASNLNQAAYDEMIRDYREVLRTSVFRQTEVQTKQGQPFLLSVMPYRTAENTIDGLVLNFVDINPVKQAQRAYTRGPTTACWRSDWCNAARVRPSAASNAGESGREHKRPG